MGLIDTVGDRLWVSVGVDVVGTADIGAAVGVSLLLTDGVVVGVRDGSSVGVDVDGTAVTGTAVGV